MTLWFEELKKEKDACYRKVRSRYKKWPSAYASGALVQCRKKGAANWGNSKKKKSVKKADDSIWKDWVSCASCTDDKEGTEPCGRKDASTQKKKGWYVQQRRRQGTSWLV